MTTETPPRTTIDLNREFFDPNPVIEITFDDVGNYKTNLTGRVHLGDGENRSVTFLANQDCILEIDEFFGKRMLVLKAGHSKELCIPDEIGKHGDSLTITWDAFPIRRAPFRGDPKIVVP